MHLTADESKKFEEWLAVKNISRKCLMCGHANRMKVSPHAFIFSTKGGTKKEAEFFAVSCDHCGATQFFAAAQARIQA
jgi:predicted nucleic-acid-binding Zn-ribbon protein